MKETNIQYDAVIAAAQKIFQLKTKDYGTAWRILRPSSLTDQIFIKASRIRSIQEKGEQKIDEDMDDAFIGILNYSIMAMIQLDIEIDMDNYEMDHEKLFAMYDALVGETKDLMIAKNHDYGEAWRDMRVSSITDLILMKLLRIKKIEENKGQTLISEGLKANYQDILNYAVFALIILTEENK